MGKVIPCPQGCHGRVRGSHIQAHPAASTAIGQTLSGLVSHCLEGVLIWQQTNSEHKCLALWNNQLTQWQVPCNFSHKAGGQAAEEFWQDQAVQDVFSFIEGKAVVAFLCNTDVYHRTNTDIIPLYTQAVPGCQTRFDGV